MGQEEARLSVNLNKVALLRNQRHVGYPDPVEAGRTLLEAGVHGLTVHPRPDQRHIRHSDVHALADMLRQEGWLAQNIEFNIEGNPFDDYLAVIEKTRPAQATLVPDSPEAATSDEGWDVFGEQDRLRQVIASLKGMGCRISLFMNAVEDPVPVMQKVSELGADRIELYTGPYADAFHTPDHESMLHLYARTGQAAVEAGLQINAGHDLTSENLPAFVSAMPRLDEVSIGHAFIADALWWGFERTVATYLDALKFKTPANAVTQESSRPR